MRFLVLSMVALLSGGCAGMATGFVDGLHHPLLPGFYLPPPTPPAARVYPPWFFESTRPSQPLWTPPTYTDCTALSSQHVTCTTHQ